MDIACDLERTIHPYRGGPAVLAVRCSQRGPADGRPDLSIAAVLDRSTSMRGAKLGEVKRAARRLVEELGPSDRLVLVAFDATAEMLAAGSGANKKPFLDAIEKLEPRRGTNLGRGLETALAFLAADQSGNVKRVLLLTDGEASVGVTDRAGLEAVARTLVALGVTTTGLGFGASYDEDLLGAIAGAGGGRLHHVKEKDDLAQVFEKELGGLRSLAARWIEVTVRPDGGARVLGARNSYPTRRSGDSLVLELSELRAGEGKTALFDILVPPSTPDQPVDRRIGDALLRWVDAQGEKHELGFSLIVKYADDATAAKAEPNGEVALEVALLDAALAKDRALALADEGDWVQGSERLMNSLVKMQTDFPKSPTLQKEIDRIAQLAKKLEKGRLEAEERKEVREEIHGGTFTARRLLDDGDGPLPQSNRHR
jgi:Ca-activated chloride channel family protein